MTVEQYTALERGLYDLLVEIESATATAEAIAKVLRSVKMRRTRRSKGLRDGDPVQWPGDAS